MSGCKWLGEIISGDEDDGGDEYEGEEDEDTYMQKQREKLEAEKEAILNNKNLIAEVCHCLACTDLPLQCVFCRSAVHRLWSADPCEYVTGC